MSKRRGQTGPSSPAAILQRAAAARAQVRASERDPTTWGVSAQIIRLPTAADVSIVTGAKGVVIAANRSDPFDLLHRAGGLSDEQHQAARRLFRDWCLRAGVNDRERVAAERVDGGRADPSDAVTAGQVDAGRRVALALKGGDVRGMTGAPIGRVGGVGPVNARLLEALISPMVDQGLIIAWRGTVQRVTGEADKNVQGGVVRQACEALRLVYDDVDQLRRDERKAADAAADVSPRDRGNRHAGGSI